MFFKTLSVVQAITLAQHVTAGAVRRAGEPTLTRRQDTIQVPQIETPETIDRSGLVVAFPVRRAEEHTLARRQTEIIELEIEAPQIVEHVGLDVTGALDLIESLADIFPPAPTVDPSVAPPERRSASNERRQTGDPFLNTPNGDAFACPETVINGPFTVLQAFTGSSNLRGISGTDMSQTKTDVFANLEGSADAGVFTLAPNERITEMFIFPSGDDTGSSGSGFNLTTDAGQTYSALANIIGDPIRVDVGSGIIGRIRANTCPTGILSATNFDFLDDLESIGISNFAYSGFTDNFLPSGPGQSLTVGSQSIDNLRGTSEQSTNINTQDAVVKQRSITVNTGFSVGGSVSVEAEASIPFITKSTVTAETNWQLQASVAETELEGQTITRGTSVNLVCGPGKFCLGTSFVTIFSLDVEIVATFRATTVTGAIFEWEQNGRYEGADSFALELRIDESDTPING